MPEASPSAAHLRACGTSLEAGVHPCEREEANLAVPQSSGQKTTSEPAPSPSGDFGANEWLVDEMYDQYKKDPKSVSPEWVKYFKSNGSGGETESGDKAPRRSRASPRRLSPRLGPRLSPSRPSRRRPRRSRSPRRRPSPRTRRIRSRRTRSPRAPARPPRPSRARRRPRPSRPRVRAAPSPRTPSRRHPPRPRTSRPTRSCAARRPAPCRTWTPP